MTLPPSPRSLFSVDIPPEFIEEFEDHLNRQRVYWRGRAREARNRRLLEERSAVASEEESPRRLDGKAVTVAAGSGPRRLEGAQPAVVHEGKVPVRPDVQAITVAAGSSPRGASEVRFLSFGSRKLKYFLPSVRVQTLTQR